MLHRIADANPAETAGRGPSTSLRTSKPRPYEGNSVCIRGYEKQGKAASSRLRPAGSGDPAGRRTPHGAAKMAR